MYLDSYQRERRRIKKESRLPVISKPVFSKALNSAILDGRGYKLYIEDCRKSSKELRRRQQIDFLSSLTDRYYSFISEEILSLARRGYKSCFFQIDYRDFNQSVFDYSMTRRDICYLWLMGITKDSLWLNKNLDQTPLTGVGYTVSNSLQIRFEWRL